MSYVASSLATVPSIGFSWYVFFVESTWNDPIGQQLRANFETLGRRVGPNTLVVRGYDEHAIANEVVEAAALYDEPVPIHITTCTAGKQSTPAVAG